MELYPPGEEVLYGAGRESISKGWTSASFLRRKRPMGSVRWGVRPPTATENGKHGLIRQAFWLCSEWGTESYGIPIEPPVLDRVAEGRQSRGVGRERRRGGSVKEEGVVAKKARDAARRSQVGEARKANSERAEVRRRGGVREGDKGLGERMGREKCLRCAGIREQETTRRDSPGHPRNDLSIK